jgi:hypothetical protein
MLLNKRGVISKTNYRASDFFHLRFALREETSPSSFLSSLPECCTLRRKGESRRFRVFLASITESIPETVLKNCDIRQAWRVIGEQSEWFLNMLDIYREDVEPYPTQILQFPHFFANMTQVRVM